MLDIARRQLDRKLLPFRKALSVTPPPLGWLRSIREALGLTLSQMGARLNISPQSVQTLEKSEIKGTISLNTLRRSAEAMDCRLFYVLVPEKLLQETVEKQMLKKATQIAKYISHSMALEDQKTQGDELAAQIQELLRDFKNSKNISKIWEEDL